ncbi:MAG: type II toxin-antitoxin system Phd/YefM family antitoxin [Nitrospiraceae bacterium]
MQGSDACIDSTATQALDERYTINVHFMCTSILGMATVNVKNARRQLKSLLERAQGGEEITIARRGKVIAKLVPPLRRPTPLPSLKRFRATIQITGRPLSVSVLQNRNNERF